MKHLCAQWVYMDTFYTMFRSYRQAGRPRAYREKGILLLHLRREWERELHQEDSN